MFWRLQALLCKTEVTYGLDSAPTGAANAILAQNVKIVPMKGTVVKRDNVTPFFAADQMLPPVGLHSTITFEVELKGSGVAGTAPAFGPLLRACKMAQVLVATTSVTYNPHSGVQESATIYFNNDGTLYKMLGCRGTYRVKLNALGIVVLEFEMTGLFVQPSAAAMPTVTLGTQLTQLPQAASSANTPVFTVAGVSLPLRSFTLDVGNEVKPRFLVGSEQIIVSDGSEKIDFQVEAVALATFNPFAYAASGSSVAMVLQHGTGAGKICTLSVPTAQVMIPDGLEEQDGITEWKLGLTPLPTNAGNDQYTLAFT